MTLGSTMSIAQQALTVNQYSLNVVSNNIANMNTEGYVKQKVNLGDIVSYASFPTAKGVSNFIGAGVEILDITSYRDDFLDNYYRNQTSETNLYDQMYSMASTVGDIMNELDEDNGIQASLSSFFEAANALNANPTSKSLRISFNEAASNLCDKFNSVSNSLTEGRAELVGDINNPGSLSSSKISATVQVLNSKFDELAKLNEEVLKSSNQGQVSSSLENQRSQLLDDISQYAPINVIKNENGTVNLSIGDVTFVKGKEVKGVLSCTQGTTEDTPAILQVLNPDDQTQVMHSDVNGYFDKGIIGGILNAGNNVSGQLGFGTAINVVNTLANSIATEINAVQNYNDGNGTKAMKIGFDADGSYILEDATEDIFTSKDGGAITAANIKLNQNVKDNPWEIAAARVDTTAADYTNKQVGDTKNLLAISDLRNTRVNDLGNQTFEEYIASSVTQIGSEVAKIKSQDTASTDALTQVKTQRESVIGVNLDEELMDLVKYQRAYEASARVFSTASDMMNTLINLGT